MTFRKRPLREAIYLAEDSTIDELASLLEENGICGGNPVSRFARQVISKHLMDGGDAKTILPAAFFSAAGQGQIECVRLLSRFIDPCMEQSRALRMAVSNNRVSVVEFLAPLSEPNGLVMLGDGWTSCLTLAARNGYTECVRILIPFSCVSNFDDEAIKDAAINGHYDAARLICEQYHNIDKITDGLRKEGFDRAAEMLVTIRQSIDLTEKAGLDALSDRRPLGRAL